MIPAALLALALAASPFRWDVPQVVSEIEVPARMETNGIPNRFHVVTSALPLAEVYAHLRRAFEQAGLYLPPDHHQTQLGEGQVMLTAFDPRTQTSYSAILIPYSRGSTGVILGEANFEDRTFAPKAAFAPLFPGAKEVVTAHLEGSQTLSYTAQATPAEVASFYAETLPSEGYLRQPDGSFLRGEESVSLVIRPLPSRPGLTEVALARVRTAGPAQLPTR